MDTLPYLRDKYKTRDIIELDYSIVDTVRKWIGMEMTGGFHVDDFVKKLAERGDFIRYLDKGVMFINKINFGRRDQIMIYPFEFTSNGTLIHSLYLDDPDIQSGPYTMTKFCSVEIDTTLKPKIITKGGDATLLDRHLHYQLTQYYNGGPSTLGAAVKKVAQTHPFLKSGSVKWEEEIKILFTHSLIHTQSITILSLHAYLTLMEKEILISKIKQQRIMTASSGTTPKRGKRNVFYRYVVQVPSNYKPRNFNLNYLLSEWSRSAHTALRWVRKENAESIVKKSGGILTSEVKGEYVGVKIPISPQTCHRKAQNAGHIGVKTYSDK